MNAVLNISRRAHGMASDNSVGPILFCTTWQNLVLQANVGSGTAHQSAAKIRDQHLQLLW